MEERREKERKATASGFRRKKIPFLILELYYLFRILELVTVFNCVIKKFLLSIGPVESAEVLYCTYNSPSVYYSGPYS